MKLQLQRGRISTTRPSAYCIDPTVLTLLFELTLQLKTHESAMTVEAADTTACECTLLCWRSFMCPCPLSKYKLALAVRSLHYTHRHSTLALKHVEQHAPSLIQASCIPPSCYCTAQCNAMTLQTTRLCCAACSANEVFIAASGDPTSSRLSPTIQTHAASSY